MNIIKQLVDADGNNIYPIGYAQGGVKMDLLWTNPSPTSSFASQTVSIDLSNYAGVLIVCKQHKSVESYFNFLSLIVAESIRFLCGSGKLAFRNATVSSAGVVFTDGSYVNTYGTDAVNNDYVIPYQIYGIKMSYIVPTTVNGLQYVEV